jgi:hypothetical protein
MKIIASAKFSPLVVLTGIAAFFSLFFLQIIRGIGGVWDWNTPLTSADLVRSFTNQLWAWQPYNLGTPISYNSDYYYRAFTGFTGYLRILPEHLLYAILTVSCTAICFGGWLIMRRTMSGWPALFLAFGLVINTAITYKILAGHTYYLISFALFVLLYGFLTGRYRGGVSQNIFIGMICAFIGVQIQFFIFTAVMLMLVLWQRRKQIRMGLSLVIIPVLVVLINAPWLISFFSGATSLGAIAAVAQQQSFDNIGLGSFTGVLRGTYTIATSLDRLIPSYAQILQIAVTGALYFVIGWYGFRRISKNHQEAGSEVTTVNIWLIALCTIGALGTATVFNIPLLKEIFRETGHFAPVLVFSLLISFAALFPRIPSFIKNTLVSGIVLITALSAVFMSQIMPRIDFADLRNAYQPFTGLNPGSTDAPYRVAGYPSANQLRYDFTRSTNASDGFPTSNASWDSFGRFGIRENFEESPNAFYGLMGGPTHALNKYNDVSGFAERNIRFITDYTAFSQTVLDRFIEEKRYGYDLMAVQAIPGKLAEIAQTKPDELRAVSTDIYEVLQASPRIPLSGGYFSQVSPTLYVLKVPAKTSEISLISTYSPGWKLVKLDDAPLIAMLDQCNNSVTLNQETVFCPSTVAFGPMTESALYQAASLPGEQIKTSIGTNTWKLVDRTTNADGFSRYALVFQPHAAMITANQVAIATICLCLIVLTISILGKFIRRHRRP